MNKTKLKYYCKDCKKKIFWQTALYGKGRCKSCSKKDNNNSKDEKNHNYKDGRWIKQHYCPICKINPISYNTWRKNGKCRKCFTKTITKEKNYKWKGGKPKCLDCNKQLKSYEGKRCYSCANKINASKRDYNGNKNPMFGKVTQTKRIYYKGICMRSSWETKFAQFINLSGIKYLYEPETFNLGNNTYTPDFYIPKWNLYVEIKGWWRKEVKEKFNLFKKLYPKINIKVLMKPELEELGVL